MSVEGTDVREKWRLTRCRTVPVGTPIRYKGNDYLAVDLSTRLLYNATSSSDLLNYYTQLGDDVIASDPGGQRSG